MKQDQIIGPGRYNYGRNKPKNTSLKMQKEENKMTVEEFIKDVLDSYKLTDTVLQYKVKVKTEKSTRTLEYPDK